MDNYSLKKSYNIYMSQQIIAQDMFQGFGAPGTLCSIGNAKTFQGLGPLRRKSCEANWMQDYTGAMPASVNRNTPPEKKTLRSVG